MEQITEKSVELTEQHSAATPADEKVNEHVDENPIELTDKLIINVAVKEKTTELITEKSVELHEKHSVATPGDEKTTEPDVEKQLN